MEIREISEKEYTDFASRFEHWTFLSTPQAGAKMLDRAQKREFVGLFDHDRLMGAAMLVLYKTAKVSQYAYLPRGPFLDFDNHQLVRDFFEALKKYLKKQNVLYLIINPYLSKHDMDADGQVIEGGKNRYDLIRTLKEAGFLEKIYDPAFEVSFMSVLDIEGKDMDTLIAEMDQQTRWSVRRALKYELTIENTKDPADMAAFARMMEHTGERRGFDGYDEAFYQSMIDHYGDMLDCWMVYLEPHKLIASQQKLYDLNEQDYLKAQAHLEKMPGSKKMIKKAKVAQEAMELAESKMAEARELEEKYGKKIPIAASMFLSTKDEMVYLFSGAYKEFLAYNAPYFIHYTALNKALEEGKKIYNFYGIMPDFQKGQEGYSLFRFKKGFGCRVVELLGNYILPVSTPSFALYNRLRPIAREIDI